MRATGSVRRRPVIGLAVAAGLLAPVHPPASALPRARGWIISRTEPGAAVLKGRLTAKAGSSEATIGTFALKGRGARRTQDGAFTTTWIAWGMDAWVHAYGYGLPEVDCPAVTCNDPAGTPASMNFHSNDHRIGSTVYIVGWDVADLSVTVSSPGWQVRSWTPDMRVVRAADGGGTGLRVLHTNRGTFHRAEADGGPYGSFVFAAIPCDNSGTGRAEFTGGTRTYEFDCGEDRSWIGGYPGRTRWRLVGDVSGTSARVNVLVVVDYPRR